MSPPVSAALLAGALVYIGLADPHSPDSVYPQCPFKGLTGWNCPACGGLRMTHDLLHGHLMASVYDNVFLLVVHPAAGRVDPGAPASQPVVAADTDDGHVGGVAATAWTVVRNLPGLSVGADRSQRMTRNDADFRDSCARCACESPDASQRDYAVSS